MLRPIQVVLLFTCALASFAQLTVNQHVLISGVFKCTGKVCLCPIRVFIESTEATHQSKIISTDGQFGVTVKHMMQNSTVATWSSLVIRDVASDMILLDQALQESNAIIDVGDINQHITPDCIQEWLKKEYNEVYIPAVHGIINADKTNSGMAILITASALVVISMVLSLALGFHSAIENISTRAHDIDLQPQRKIAKSHAAQEAASDTFEALFVDQGFVKRLSATNT